VRSCGRCRIVGSSDRVRDPTEAHPGEEVGEVVGSFLDGDDFDDLDGAADLADHDAVAPASWVPRGAVHLEVGPSILDEVTTLHSAGLAGSPRSEALVRSTVPAPPAIAPDSGYAGDRHPDPCADCATIGDF
jgi:hypothetical protein